MTAATDLDLLFSAFDSAQLARDTLIQVAVLAGTFGLAWFIARSLRARLGGRKVRWKFGEGGFNRVIFPLAALAFTWGAMLVLRRYAPVPFLNLAVTLLIAFSLIRALVYVLRFVLPEGAFLRGSERTIAWTMWVGVLLYVTGLLPEVTGALDSVSFDLGKQRISLLLILKAAVAVAVTLAVSMWFARVLEGRVMANDDVQMSTRVVVSKFIRAIALFVAILIALPLVGLDLTALTVFGGALGVGLGFGLQKIASNYVSGYIILLDHSIRIGDLVTVDNRHGEVREIAARYTVVKSGDGTESIIPNETLITQSVTNHSYSDRKFAVKVPVSVGYDSDIDAAMDVLLQAARAHPRVIADPAPGVSINRLAETGIELELTAWINDPENGQGGLRSDILRTVLGRFRERGVVLPPPPREIRFLATPETQISTTGSNT
ncbi:mechanosensitive ion channel family protein [Usitatibacter palustris]|uniref:Mechanosensitive ion channel n=1 Tax=Usitatibacter palustris TaxID=2732487 RepID=A0A6M4H374_9PROT|nr:mechanosensitive ion channel domain-containing protein [Usitatibacter palustris]QJR14019.1 hypothetical protein DSM104440_00811 [Usitatibacter palustris]